MEINEPLQMMLDNLPVGFVLIEKDMSLIMANSLARSSFTDEGLFIQDGRLTINNRVIYKKLRSLIKYHSKFEYMNEEATALQLPNLSEIRIISTSVSEHTQQIIIYTPILENNRLGSVESIMLSFNLTAAEVRVVQALHGYCHNLNEVAEYLEISKHTVRTHMKSIYIKTRTTSQLELIKKIHNAELKLAYNKSPS